MAGNPAKQKANGTKPADLNPRASFQTWKENVRGRPLPWTDDNLTVAQGVRSYFRDLILFHRDASDEQKARTEAQRELLHAELTHRVKNVHGLVKSLASQPAFIPPASRSSRRRLKAGCAHCLSRMTNPIADATAENFAG